MKKKLFCSGVALIASLLIAVPLIFAQTPVDDLTTVEPYKSMAQANEAFLKKETDKAAEYIHKAAAYCHQESGKVADSGKKYMKKAGDGLDKLGRDVKSGAVTSEHDLKMGFAKAGQLSAKAWQETMADSKAAGKDVSEAFKKAGAGLDSAARWSGTQLKEGGRKTVETAKKVGHGTKAAAEDVDKWVKHLGEGIEDVGRNLK